MLAQLLPLALRETCADLLSLRVGAAEDEMDGELDVLRRDAEGRAVRLLLALRAGVDEASNV